MIDDVTNGMFSGIQKSDTVSDNSSAAKNDIPTTDDEFEQEMRDRFELLPQDLKDIIINTDYPTVLFEIAKKNQIKFDDIEKIELGTMMVLLGIKHPNELHDEFKTQLNKNGTEINEIIKEIDEKIFSKVKDSLHKLYTDNYGEEPKEDIAQELKDQQEIEALEKEDINDTNIQQNYPTKPVVPQNSTPAPISIPVQVVSPAVPSRAELLDGIENPIKTQATTPETIANQVVQPTPTPAPVVTPNIVASKLTMSSTPIPNKTTDYTIPKTNQNGAGGSDPYRELPN